MELKTLEFKDRVINLFGDIDETTVNDTISKIVELNVTDTDYINNVVGVIGSAGFKINPEIIELPPIMINLSTYGGSCYDGFALCDSIRTSDTPIKIICYGKIMSMGIPILLSAKYKAAHKNTTFMIHGASAFAIGKVESMKESLEESVRIQKEMVDYILNNSKFPKKKMQQILDKKEDFFFTTKQALEWKIIDEIIE